MKKLFAIILTVLLAAGLAIYGMAAVPGDVNNDGQVNARDVRALLNALASGQELDAGAADINGDGQINARDIRALLSTLAGNGEQAPATTYTVTIKTAGGMPMSGLGISIYTDESLTKLSRVERTDANGSVQLDDLVGSGYVAVITGAPVGYHVESYYPLTNAIMEIVLTSAPIQGDLGSAQLGLGDVMYDFTVTTADGREITLSQLLQEKEMVMLNFWFSTCYWCQQEFPCMEEAYQTYQDDIAIVALDPFEGSHAIGDFQEAYGLSFDMAACPYSWATAFGISGYPTSVVIDRYGVICLISVGAITSRDPFDRVFSYFTGDAYEQRLFASVFEIPA